MRRAEITGENDALIGVGDRVGKIKCDIGRAEDMGSTLQANPAVKVFGILQGEPILIGQRDDVLFNQL